MSDCGFGSPADYIPKLGLRSGEIAFLQICEPDVYSRHSVGGIGAQDLLELLDAVFGVSGVHEHETVIVAGIEIRRIEFYGAAVCFYRDGIASSVLQGKTKLIPGFGIRSVQRCCRAQLNQGFAIMGCIVKRAS